MKWHVYILECSNKALYTGITTDLGRRFEEHRSGKGCRYTSYNPGKKFKYFETYRTQSKAAGREAEIKGLTRAKKLALIMTGKGHAKRRPRGLATR